MKLYKLKATELVEYKSYEEKISRKYTDKELLDLFESMNERGILTSRYLSEKQAEVLILRIKEGNQSKHIAECMKISRARVSELYKQGIKSMRLCLYRREKRSRCKAIC